MINLENKKILITGSSSMVGSSIIRALQKRNAIISECNHSYYDLLSYTDAQQMFVDIRPEYVIHAAGWNGGLAFNLKYGADIFYKTAKMALNVLTLCPEFGVEKILSIISSCALPEDPSLEPLKAENLWQGSCNPSVECHGLSKRILDVYSRQLNKQFGLNAICAILTNCYGPKDSFNLEKTKVVCALIRKFVEAKEQNKPEVVCFGSGKPLRELMFCYDAGEALVQTLEKYENVQTPLCVGTGQDITIADLTYAISEIVGYTGKISWDTTKQDGQMRKLLDTTKMREILDVKLTDFKVGLTETISWYLNNRKIADEKY